MDIQRDWGWAPEYVEAMYLMLQQEQPDDYVIATGESSKLEDFVATAFATVGLNWPDHVISDRSLLRPTDLAISRGNPGKAKEKLGWQAQYKMSDIVRMMVENRLEK
jgi:GDPmannose 4,6-dehydratase